MHIRCPSCRWEPDGGAHWQCDRCGEVFDTFSTHARCPGCLRIFGETQCIACGVWSLHEDWYDGDWPVLKETVEEEMVAPAPLIRPGK